MKRPLATVGLSFFCGSVFAAACGVSAALIFSGLCLLAGGGLLLFRKKVPRRWMGELGGILLGLAVSGLLFFTAAESRVVPARQWAGKTRTVTGVVVSDPTDYGSRRRMLIRCESPSLTVELNTVGLVGARPGDRVRGRITFAVPPAHRQAYLQADGVYLTASDHPAAPVKCIGVQNGPDKWAGNCRRRLKETFQHLADKEPAGLMAGICLGDTDGLSESTVQDFTDCGIGHLVAVSGLHTGTVGALFLMLFLLVRRGRRVGRIASTVLVWDFALLTGFSYSAVRAAIMFTFFAVGSMLRRKADLLNTLGGAALTILILHPFAGMSMGFINSVACCAAIILLADPFRDALCRLFGRRLSQKPWVTALCSAIAVTLAAGVAMVICSLFYYKTLNLFTLPANLLCVPLGCMVLLLGLTGGLLTFVPWLSAIGKLLITGGALLCRWILDVTHAMASVTGGVRPFAGAAAVLGAAILVVWLCIRFWRFPKLSLRRSVAGGLAVVILVVGATFVPRYLPGQYEILVLPEQRRASLVITGDFGAVVIGAPSTGQLKQLLQKRGVRTVSGWILPRRTDYDTVLTRLAEGYDMSRLYTDDRTLLRRFGRVTDQAVLLTAGQSLTFGGVTVTVITEGEQFLVTTPEGSVLFSDRPAVRNDCLCTVVDGQKKQLPLLMDDRGQKTLIPDPLRLRLKQNRVIKSYETYPFC